MRSHMHITGYWYCVLVDPAHTQGQEMHLDKYARYVGVDTCQMRLQYVY